MNKLASLLVLFAGLSAPSHANEFLIQKMADFYSSAMNGEDIKKMSSYDRGLFEGMSLGFVLGQYPEQAQSIASMNEDDFNESFYPLIKKQCPQYSFK